MNHEAAMPVGELIEVLALQRRFQPYPAYRPSGIRWVGPIPEHWAVQRLKHVASLRTSNVDKKSDDNEQAIRLCNYVDVYHRDYITADIPFMEATASPDEIRRFRLLQGDVLITKDSEEWNDIAVPAYVDEELDGVVCGYHLAQVRPFPEHAHGEYLFRAFAAHAIRDQFRIAANGITRFGLSRYSVATALFPLPPVGEQEAIARFLRCETDRIDALIAKKERLIELLQEKRAALISHAVTKGLDPDAPMKDSGIPWLGELPKHWQVRRMKFAALIGNGSTPSRENPDYWDGWFPWLNSSVVNLTEVTEPTELVSDLALRECHLPRIPPPAVLVGITGEGKTRGMVTVLRIEATINQHLAFVRPRNHDCHVEYVRYVLHAAYEFLRDESDGGGSTKGAITCNRLGNTAIPFPPANEQRAIAYYLDTELVRFDSLAARVRTAIDKLSEYRSALISAAVTGKIDVREEGAA